MTLPVVLPVSLVLAAFAALFNGWLAWRVGEVRRRERILIGDGGSMALIRRMRAQANFVETAPFVLVLVALIEMATTRHGALGTIAAAYAIARLFHAIGMEGSIRARAGGMAGTMLVLLVLAIWALALPIIARDRPSAGGATVAAPPFG